MFKKKKKNKKKEPPSVNDSVRVPDFQQLWKDEKLMRRARAARVWNFPSIPWTVSCINSNASNEVSIGEEWRRGGGSVVLQCGGGGGGGGESHQKFVEFEVTS